MAENTCKDVSVLRELAIRYREICRKPEQKTRRDLWRSHNSLGMGRPLIYVRAFAWQEMPDSRCVCEDPFYRRFENFFRYQIFWDSLNDDSVFEPWVTLEATNRCTGWGLKATRLLSDETGGAFKEEYPIRQPEDIEKLKRPFHSVDEEKTNRDTARLLDALGDILPVTVDRSPPFRSFAADISSALGHLRGIENIMLDMMDRPEWLHRLLSLMSKGILAVQEQAERAGDWCMTGHANQAMPYAEELPDPALNVGGIQRKQLWAFMAAQEYTLISPAMHDEFLLQYQIPILRHFGLSAYGCCEDLTRKIDILRKIPNLRRIAVSPFADVARCAEQIGRDYVFSYRPSPADMVSYGWNENRVRSLLKKDLEASKKCCVDITLKDVETVEKDANRVRQWVTLARQVIDEVYG